VALSGAGGLFIWFAAASTFVAGASPIQFGARNVSGMFHALKSIFHPNDGQ
jgi:hypothetical protein